MGATAAAAAAGAMSLSAGTTVSVSGVSALLDVTAGVEVSGKDVGVRAGSRLSASSGRQPFTNAATVAPRPRWKAMPGSVPARAWFAHSCTRSAQEANDTFSILLARGRAQVSVAASRGDWPKRTQDQAYSDQNHASAA